MLNNHDTNIRFYGRRKGRALSAKKQRLVDNLLSELLIDEKKSLADNFCDKEYKEYHLEIGFGAGEHLASVALANPDIAHIGAEVFINGVAALIGRIEADNIKNIRLIHDDIRLYLADMPDNFFSHIYLLFPDPWPKRRHCHRRFISHENMQEVARILKKGGIFQVASDDMNYCRWALMHLLKNENFHWQVTKPRSCYQPFKDWHKTRYEEKALKLNKNCIYLEFLRI